MQMLVFQNLVYIKTLPFAIQLHPNDPIKGGTSRQKKTDCLLKTIGFLYLWRRSRDSNPGRGSTLNGFQDRRFRPLSHLSTRCL